MRRPWVRGWLVWLLVVAGLAGGSRMVVALPEHCPTASPASVADAARSTVQWFARNQRADGTWRYRLDVDTGQDLGGYNWVRHAGVMLALQQAATAGLTEARDVADRGGPAILDQLVAVDDRLALEDGGSLSTGGSALLTVALAERRLATGDPVDDDRLRALGRYLASQVEPAGSVLNTASLEGAVSVPGTYSPFATGQVVFALARLERLFPGEGFAEPVRRIAAYLAHDRAAAEGYVPDTSDHWAAYGFAEVVRWPGPEHALLPDELAFARKQMGILGIQVRYESQRTNAGVDRWLRGRTTSGSGLGTLGEGLWRWSLVAAAEPALDGERAWLRDRLACAASMVVARQIDASAAARLPDPTAAEGAFAQFGITQMDDQQHSLSTLLGAVDLAASAPAPLPRRTPVPASALLVALVALAALNPPRLARLARGASAPTAAKLATAGAAVAVGLAALLGGPLLRALDVSAATAVVAAGLSVAVAGLATSVWPRGRDDEGPGPAGRDVADLGTAVARPDLLLLAVAVGAGGQGWALVIAVGLGVVAAWLPALVTGRTAVPEQLLRWALRLTAVAAVAGAVALVVDGVYAV